MILGILLHEKAKEYKRDVSKTTIYRVIQSSRTIRKRVVRDNISSRKCKYCT
jgi:hypothetical protein